MKSEQLSGIFTANLEGLFPESRITTLPGQTPSQYSVTRVELTKNKTPLEIWRALKKILPEKVPYAHEGREPMERDLSLEILLRVGRESEYCRASIRSVIGAQESAFTIVVIDPPSVRPS